MLCSFQTWRSRLDVEAATRFMFQTLILCELDREHTKYAREYRRNTK